MAGPTETSDVKALFGAAILLAKPIRLDRDSMMEALRLLVGQAGAHVRILDETKRTGFLSTLRGQQSEIRVEISGVRLIITAVNRPLCTPPQLHAFVNPAIWRGGLRGLDEHRAHILVTEDPGRMSNSRDARFDRATAVTLATGAIATLGEAMAVIWMPARNSLPMDVFATEIERFLQGQAPLLFWLRWQVLPAPVQREQELGQLAGEALHPGLATIGLAAFIGADIIAPPSRINRDVMLDHVFALASRVIDENIALEDGASYGATRDTRVFLNLRRSGPYSERPFWELLPTPVAPLKAVDNGGGVDTAQFQRDGTTGGIAPQRNHLRVIS